MNNINNLNLFDLAESNGIKVYKYTFNNDEANLAGKIEYTPLGPIISLNDMETIFKRRERLVLSYELAHFFLHKGLNFYDHKTTFSHKPQCHTTYNYAMDLILPKGLILELGTDILKESPDIEHDDFVQTLADTFTVSLSVMKSRLFQLFGI